MIIGKLYCTSSFRYRSRVDEPPELFANASQYGAFRFIVDFKGAESAGRPKLDRPIAAQINKKWDVSAAAILIVYENTSTAPPLAAALCSHRIKPAPY